MAQGQIIKALSGFYYIYDQGKTFQTRGRGNFRKRKITPLVGDFVEYESTNETDGYVLAILPRINELNRPPIANVDQGVIVTSAREPDFNSNLLDRLIVHLAQQKITPIIYFTKTDLMSATDYDQLVPISDYYRHLGYTTIIDSNPYAAPQINQLKSLFDHHLTVFTGQSGAGKSTLLNHIEPHLALATAAISQSLNRGKHTTRHVELHALDGGLVADTPGFSSLQLEQVTLSDLGQFFADFNAVSDECRFRQCEHDQEPGCAVKAAVEAGTIMVSRYTNYLQFREEIAKRKPKYEGKR